MKAVKIDQLESRLNLVISSEDNKLVLLRHSPLAEDTRPFLAATIQDLSEIENLFRALKEQIGHFGQYADVKLFYTDNLTNEQLTAIEEYNKTQKKPYELGVMKLNRIK